MALTLGVLGRSRKPHEHRLPLHPRQLDRIAPELRGDMTFEAGYGERFGVGDGALATAGFGVARREEVIAGADVVVLPKPLEADLEQLRARQVLWGWPHCVQDPGLTQVAIDRRLTLVAWEAMNHWSDDGHFELHVFHQNNELAGFCSVGHALQLAGRTGHYGRALRAAVISFGATGRGAVRALGAAGVQDVTVLTQRDVAAVAAPFTSMRLVSFERDETDPAQARTVTRDGASRPLIEELAEHDIIVNCVLQDPEEPLTLATTDDLERLAPGTIVVDVSIDPGMGFGWARATSFAVPMITVGDRVHYYAVDHSPSLLWDSASWVIGEALLGHLETVAGGPESWEADPTIHRAIEIEDGVVRNPRILSFQNREAAFPHARRG
ncbi:MAG: Alanine dehydrogenase [uncultured Solirubrobacteraceae bacterium]|uniref:Alanine dehydrogenase n=1 Tax=uncultured Solirubrobacteraceae bacterium TaxID=1162706 RepID=A0A6J4TH10_9ACTN|nr:MAG: Alanine dehydrogenase [uncultured Solirubrobacteraceae bacterium]